eukprot:SAG31_NODE_13081_length_894_cov_1.096855_1_plen_44_part_10
MVALAQLIPPRPMTPPRATPELAQIRRLRHQSQTPTNIALAGLL